MDDFPSFQVEFLEEISDEKLCLSLEEVESEQKVNDSVRFATLNEMCLFTKFIVVIATDTVNVAARAKSTLLTVINV